jgi:dTDP-4-amino-4,6-dideoxygalactose transaminase
MIPFFGLDREYKKYREEYIDIFDKTMLTGKVLQGDAVGQLESCLAAKVGRKFAVAVNSATDALYFALVSCGIKPGDEVLVSNFSFIASASCIIRLGAVPVFCDIDTDDYHMLAKDVAAQTTTKTKAIVFPHMFGGMSDIADLLSFCSDNSILFIEDAAQSFGASFSRVNAGALGDCSCISFDPTKVLGAPGSGGMFLTDDIDKAEVVRKLRYHGKNTSGFFEILGFNSQMPTLTAEILNFKLTKNDEWKQKRQDIAQYYSENLINVPARSQFKTLDNDHAFHKYTLLFNDTLLRNNYYKGIKTNDVGCMIHYERPLEDHTTFSAYNVKRNKAVTSNAKIVCSRILSIPIHPWLTDAEVERVVDVIISLKAS